MGFSFRCESCFQPVSARELSETNAVRASVEAVALRNADTAIRIFAWKLRRVGEKSRWEPVSAQPPATEPLPRRALAGIDPGRSKCVWSAATLTATESRWPESSARRTPKGRLDTLALQERLLGRDPCWQWHRQQGLNEKQLRPFASGAADRGHGAHPWPARFALLAAVPARGMRRCCDGPCRQPHAWTTSVARVGEQALATGP